MSDRFENRGAPGWRAPHGTQGHRESEVTGHASFIQAETNTL